jgi:hypothetical protein
MTHEELLAKINEELSTDYADANGNYPLGLNALRAIVELHKPWDKTKYGYDYCKACEKNGLGYRNYPCPTIQAIEKELA